MPIFLLALLPVYFAIRRWYINRQVKRLFKDERVVKFIKKEGK